jgi:UDP-N-acetylmuramoylalanine--D-glutamate ligase
MIGHVLSEAGVRAEVGGNIGRALIGIADLEPPPDWVVIEASSFQLHDAPHLDPTIGVLTNLSPDHLNRYASVEDYYADKRKMLQHADDASIWVANGDDREVARMMRGVPGRMVTWSLSREAAAWLDRDRGTLVLDGEDLMPRDDFPLLGDHNVENALAAALATKAAGVSLTNIAGGLRTFRSLAHRLEPVRNLDGVSWINDSKATNVGSARAALQAVTRPFVLIAGGRHKNEDFRALIPYLSGCRLIVAYGEAADKFAREVGSAMEVRTVGCLADAVREARRAALPGAAVLLSPACASFDQFTSYEERGNIFKELVRALT